MLWPPDASNWLIGKDPDAGKDWRQEEKGTTEDEMVGCHHWLHGHEFEQAPEVGEGQGSLVCCSPWDPKSRTWLSDWTELNWNPIKSVIETPLKSMPNKTAEPCILTTAADICGPQYLSRWITLCLYSLKQGKHYLERLRETHSHIWRNMPCSCMGRTIWHYKDAQLIYRFNAILVQTPEVFPIENWQTSYNIYMEILNNLEENNQSWRTYQILRLTMELW